MNTSIYSEVSSEHNLSNCTGIQTICSIYVGQDLDTSGWKW